jgi:hypothetical protein
MYANGEGALQDLSKAKYWIKKAYEGGNARAKEALDAFELFWQIIYSSIADKIKCFFRKIFYFE